MARLVSFNVYSCVVVAVFATIFVIQSTEAFRQVASVSKTSTKLTKLVFLNMAGDGDQKENSFMDILSGMYSKQTRGKTMILILFLGEKETKVSSSCIYICLINLTNCNAVKAPYHVLTRIIWLSSILFLLCFEIFLINGFAVPK